MVFEEAAMDMPTQSDVLKAIEEKFGTVDDEVRDDVLLVHEPEYLESILDDLRLCDTVEDLRRQLLYFFGRQGGHTDGLRTAISIVLGIRDDDLAERISEQAFTSTDPEELTRLLVLAVAPISQTNPSAN